MLGRKGLILYLREEGVNTIMLGRKGLILECKEIKKINI